MSNDDQDDDTTLPLDFGGWCNFGSVYEPPSAEVFESSESTNSRATALNKNDSSCPCGNDRVNSDEVKCWLCGCPLKH